MDDDPRTDFFASDDTTPTPSGDARTAFFDSPNVAPKASSEPVYNAALFRKRVGRDPEPAELANFKTSKGVGWAGDPTQGKFTAGQAALGAAEDVGSLATSAAASVPAAIGYLAGATGLTHSDSLSNARAVRNTLTYQPRTEAGQAGMETIGQIRPGEIVPRLLDVAGYPNAADTTREVEERTADVAPFLGEAAAAFPASRAIGRGASKIVSSMADPEAEFPSSMMSPQSMGAAKAGPQLAVSSELQRAYQAASQQTGGNVSQDVWQRHVEADSLPVRMQLTEGQATQDPVILSNEVNSRGKNPAIAQRYTEQNQHLVQNLQALRDQVGPDVFSTNPVEHADTLIDAYQAKDKIARSAIDDAYDTARKALPPTTPVLDAKQLLGNVNSLLEDKWATESAPPDIMKRLQTIADGKGVVTAGQFEGLRTRLADLSRSGDGNTRYAAHLIRGVVEDQPLLPGTEAFKAPFDNARALARTRFQAMEADPAYNAAVNETVSPDRFIQKFVTGGTRDNVTLMRQNLKDSPSAQQTIGVAALDHLRQSAGIDSMGNGNFSQAGFNKHLQALSPKLSSLVDPGTAETLEQLGNVARYTQAQPRGAFVNNSNTFTAQAANAAANALEGIANAKAAGLPVGTMIRKAAANRAQARATAEALKPGAGLTYQSPTAITRASGGKVDHEALVARLINRWKAAKKETDKTTAPLLKMPDSAIVKALDLAQEHI